MDRIHVIARIKKLERLANNKAAIGAESSNAKRAAEALKRQHKIKDVELQEGADDADGQFDTLLVLVSSTAKPWKKVLACAIAVHAGADADVSQAVADGEMGAVACKRNGQGILVKRALDSIYKAFGNAAREEHFFDGFAAGMGYGLTEIRKRRPPGVAIILRPEGARMRLEGKVPKKKKEDRSGGVKMLEMYDFAVWEKGFHAGQEASAAIDKLVTSR